MLVHLTGAAYLAVCAGMYWLPRHLMLTSAALSVALLCAHLVLSGHEQAALPCYASLACLFAARFYPKWPWPIQASVATGLTALYLAVYGMPMDAAILPILAFWVARLGETLHDLRAMLSCFLASNLFWLAYATDGTLWWLAAAQWVVCFMLGMRLWRLLTASLKKADTACSS